jgi:EmrB/QacA subfamily drug resistance transporter
MGSYVAFYALIHCHQCVFRYILRMATLRRRVQVAPQPMESTLKPISAGQVQAAASVGVAEIRTPRSALAALSLAMLLSALGSSIGNVALPTLAQAFAASFQAVQWVVLAYLLAITTLIVSAGRLGDLIGRRRLLLSGIALFTLASLACSVAPTLGWMIAARAAQGLGAAILMALAMAFVGDAVPKARIGSALGLLGTMSAIGTALGPSLGGFLIAWSGWQAIFLVSASLGGITFALAWRALPGDHREQAWARNAFDTVGTLLLAATLTAYALAMTLGRGGFGALNIMLLVAAGVGVVVFLVAEVKVASPLIPLAVFGNPALAGSLIANALVSTVIMATLVVGPFYLAGALGLDVAHVGLALSLGPLVVALTGVPAGRLVDRFGASRIVVAGLAGMATGSVLLATLPGIQDAARYLVPIMVVTAGYALFQTANSTTIMAGASADQRGVISGTLNLSRNLGFVTGASAMGAVFAVASTRFELSMSHPAAVAAGMRTTFAAGALLIVAALVTMLTSRRLAIRPAAPTSLSADQVVK